MSTLFLTGGLRLRYLWKHFILFFFFFFFYHFLLISCPGRCGRGLFPFFFHHQESFSLKLKSSCCGKSGIIFTRIVNRKYLISCSNLCLFFCKLRFYLFILFSVHVKLYLLIKKCLKRTLIFFKISFNPSSLHHQNVKYKESIDKTKMWFVINHIGKKLFTFQTLNNFTSHVKQCVMYLTVRINISLLF